jgi:hypothetical protein
MVFDEKRLKLFLVQAKQNTYASQQGKVAPSRRGANDLGYRSNGYYYLDSYFGEKDFSGQEIVYLNNSPLWSMNYYGRMLRDDVPQGFIETLRDALMRVEESSPYRGCDHLRNGDFEYYCQSAGTISAFTGMEHIEHMKEAVYRLHFHGGLIRYA